MFLDGANFICDIAIWIAPGNQVYGFGSGKRGQLGISRDKIKYVNLSQVTCGLEDVQIVSISANGDHSAAISGEGLTYFLFLTVAMKADRKFLA